MAQCFITLKSSLKSWKSQCTISLISQNFLKIENCPSISLPPTRDNVYTADELLDKIVKSWYIVRKESFDDNLFRK